VFLETDRAVYRLADWSKLGSVIQDSPARGASRKRDDRGGSSSNALEKLEPVEAALETLGYERLGDIHCDRLGELYLRGYASPDGLSYACVAAGTFGQFAVDFVTRFADGTVLTTSTTPNLKSRPKLKVVKRSHPDDSTETLHRRHADEIARRASEGVAAESVVRSLKGFCLALDDYIAREIDG
jgi:hypothetical protein